MTIQQLNYVITISEVGLINKASEILYISQPSLTESVKDMEKELGITIFLRSGRGVTLTPEGADFILYARQVVNDYKELPFAEQPLYDVKLQYDHKRRFRRV